MDWTAIWLSVRLATATTMVLVAIGVPIAYWIVFSPRRWKFLVEAIVALPLVLPPTVLGFYVLIAIGPLSQLFLRLFDPSWRPRVEIGEHGPGGVAPVGGDHAACGVGRGAAEIEP